MKLKIGSILCCLILLFVSVALILSKMGVPTTVIQKMNYADKYVYTASDLQEKNEIILSNDSYKMGEDVAYGIYDVDSISEGSVSGVAAIEGAQIDVGTKLNGMYFGPGSAATFPTTFTIDGTIALTPSNATDITNDVKSSTTLLVGQNIEAGKYKVTMESVPNMVVMFTSVNLTPIDKKQTDFEISLISENTEGSRGIVQIGNKLQTELVLTEGDIIALNMYDLSDPDVYKYAQAEVSFEKL